ncbi:hypothetical protein CO683_32745 [Bradyrhizobium ottawaense]|nr:hypothetical protein CO683_32745 [Bradyrhizobium ottawaense]
MTWGSTAIFAVFGIAPGLALLPGSLALDRKATASVQAEHEHKTDLNPRAENLVICRDCTGKQPPARVNRPLTNAP